VAARRHAARRAGRASDRRDAGVRRRAAAHLRHQLPRQHRFRHQWRRQRRRRDGARRSRSRRDGGAIRICCAFATSLDSPEHIAVAERLGYERAWLYDASQHYPDVWMVLALAAARTGRIGLGPGVLVPQVRHPVVNVAGAATLSALAPGRVAVAFGRGFTGARAMSAKPSAWAYVRDYVAAFRALLAGETVDWQGERLRMLHPAGHARPIDVPVLIAAGGPKGAGTAHEVGDGLFAAMPLPEFVAEFAWTSLQVGGTVLRPGEALDTPRVRETAGPTNAFAYHARYELGGDVTELPA
jgi:5,10-methylenetetrahydromethanopterin reductase